MVSLANDPSRATSVGFVMTLTDRTPPLLQECSVMPVMPVMSSEWTSIPVSHVGEIA